MLVIVDVIVFPPWSFLTFMVMDFKISADENEQQRSASKGV